MSLATVSQTVSRATPYTLVRTCNKTQKEYSTYSSSNEGLPVSRIHWNNEQKIAKLKEDIGASTDEELIDNGIALLEWAVEQIKSGRSIASVSIDEKRWKPLEMPIFATIRAKSVQ